MAATFDSNLTHIWYEYGLERQYQSLPSSSEIVEASEWMASYKLDSEQFLESDVLNTSLLITEQSGEQALRQIRSAKS